MTAVAHLRQATGQAHQALDQGLDIMDRLAAPEPRRLLVAGYRTLHAGVEAAVEPFLANLLATRRRSALIGPGNVAPLHALAPVIASRPAALGALYVVEGATLGGRMILRQLEQAGHDTRDLAFLSPYGAQTGAMWRALLDLLERELTAPAPLADAVGAAVRTFAFARACLTPPPLHAAA